MSVLDFLDEYLGEALSPQPLICGIRCKSHFLCVGTCEVGGLTPIQALEIVRGCRGMKIVGADLVEVDLTV